MKKVRPHQNAKLAQMPNIRDYVASMKYMKARHSISNNNRLNNKKFTIV